MGGAGKSKKGKWEELVRTKRVFAEEINWDGIYWDGGVVRKCVSGGDVGRRKMVIEIFLWFFCRVPLFLVSSAACMFSSAFDVTLFSSDFRGSMAVC